MFYPAMTKSWGSFPGVSFSGTNFQQLASVPERCETAQLLEALDSQAGNLWAIDEGDSKNSIAGFAAIDPCFFFLNAFFWIEKLMAFRIYTSCILLSLKDESHNRRLDEGVKGVFVERFTVRMVGMVYT